MKDLLGQVFGSLTVIGLNRQANRVRNAKGLECWQAAWVCRCVCGKEVSLISNRLTSGLTRSCGCRNPSALQDLTDRQFGQLRVLRLDPDRTKRVRWICRCECGVEKSIQAIKLKNGGTITCGCGKRKTKHSPLRIQRQREAFALQRERFYDAIVSSALRPTPDGRWTPVRLRLTRQEFLQIQNTQHTALPFICGYGHEFTLTGQRFMERPFCQQCFGWISAPEMQVRIFLTDLCPEESVQGNVKSPFPGVHEIDIFLPGLRLAVEFDGLYWHQEREGHKNDRHLTKREILAQHQVRLVQIRADEWEFKRPIVESMLRSLCRKSTARVGARELQIRQVTPQSAHDFLEKNHLMGSFRAARTVGLFRGEELLCVLSYRVHQDGSLEIARFASQLNLHVSGGFTKLLQHVERLTNPTCVISWVDLRYANGHSLELAGFKCERITLGWHWTDGTYTFNRLACRAGQGKTERENAEARGLKKIYDAGQALWVKAKP